MDIEELRLFLVGSFTAICHPKEWTIQKAFTYADSIIQFMKDSSILPTNKENK